jgi:hypothetical protein
MSEVIKSPQSLFTSSKFVNYLHIFGIAPALMGLRYRPDLVRFAPVVAGAVVAFHGYEVYKKSRPTTSSAVFLHAEEVRPRDPLKK